MQQLPQRIQVALVVSVELLIGYDYVCVPYDTRNTLTSSSTNIAIGSLCNSSMLVGQKPAGVV